MKEQRRRAPSLEIAFLQVLLVSERKHSFKKRGVINCSRFWHNCHQKQGWNYPFHGESHLQPSAEGARRCSPKLSLWIRPQEAPEGTTHSQGLFLASDQCVGIGPVLALRIRQVTLESVQQAICVAGFVSIELDLLSIATEPWTIAKTVAASCLYMLEPYTNFCHVQYW